jgi:hypothetical protein
VLDQLWERIDGGAAERVLFVQVAQRALAPGSNLAAARWVPERVAIADCPGFSDDSAYAAMDFLWTRWALARNRLQRGFENVSDPEATPFDAAEM